MKWQQLFQKHILDRGFDYYKRGLVADLDVGEDGIEATVQGSEDYEVCIDTGDGDIIDMSCDCPYAADGGYCKHMAAVLFCLEAEKEDPRDDNRGETLTAKSERELAEESIAKLVKEADETLVRNFLIGILQNDEKLLNRFRSALCCEISPADMKRYKSQIDRVFINNTDRHNFIDYYSAGALASELEAFLDEDIQGMLDNGQYTDAFELTNYIFVKIGNQDMDDSDGEIGVLAERCLEIWQEIAAHGSRELKRKMFQWYKDHLDGSVIDYMDDYLEQILFENFKEEEFLADKLKFSEAKLREHKRKEDSWSRGYHAGKWAVRHLVVMEEQKASPSMIDEYCKKNLEFSQVRNYYIENCLKRQAYEPAIQALEEGKVIDKDSRGLVADYSLQLKDLYKQLGNRQAYEKELRSLVLDYKAGDVHLFKELKSLYGEKEWQEQRELIFRNLPPYAGIDKLYEIEKLYDRLLEIVLNTSGLYKLTEYEKCLQTIYPKELLEKYETVLKNMAGRASDRKRYQEMVAILRRMQKYPEGKEKVREIVTDWQSAYRNRRAMMDELKKL